MTVAKANIKIPDDQRLLTKEQAAHLCGMSPNTFAKYAKRMFTARKFGARVMYDRDQINQQLDRLYGVSNPNKAANVGANEAMQLLDAAE